MSFQQKLAARIEETESILVVGLDPRPDRLPRGLANLTPKTGETLQERIANAYFEFARQLIDTIGSSVVGVKTQIAFYERLGAAGIRALQKTIRYARERGLVTIQDAKRGDIGSTMQAYSDAHIGETRIGNQHFSTFDADAMTINPLLGHDSVEILFETCIKRNKAIFCLVRTSNPGANDIQLRTLSSGLTVSEHLAQIVTQWARRCRPTGSGQYSPIGAVVAGNLQHPEEASRLRHMLPHSTILAPGIGAQGGKPSQVKALFDDTGGGLLVTAARSIIYAHERSDIDLNFPDASLQAVSRLNRALAALAG